MSTFRVRKRFVDTIRLYVCGGNGGMGLPKYNGVGGKGGSVYLKAAPGVKLKTVLQNFSKNVVKAESGQNSKAGNIFGAAGKDKIVKVPEGVTVYDTYMRKLGELDKKGDMIVVAEGGPGGSLQSCPAFSGSKGHSQIITIDLKLIADVGLVGFPNAGKSSLLKAISRAKPKIAAYAFTTLQPNIGVLAYSDFRQIKMADLPGLVEGASHNVGMGHQFLKHIERSSLLLLVVDINGFQLTPQCEHRNCIESIILLNKELELYKEELLDKPAILAINKMDLPGAPTTFKEILPHLKDLPGYAFRLPEELRPKKYLKFDHIIPISALADEISVNNLKLLIRESLDKHYELSLIDVMTRKEIELLKKIRRENDVFNKIII